MRLIDADAMRENLLWCKEQSGSYDDYWDDVIERLDAQPTVGRCMSDNDICSGFRNLIMALRSETHNTNSIAFMHGGKSFVAMMEDENIKGFGDWMFNNGFNTALTVAECYIRKLMNNLNVDQD